MRKAVVIAVLGMLLLASCSETKYVAEDEYLLDRVKVKSDRKSRHLNISELKSYIRQRGNSRWFSAVKLPLRTYSLSGRDTSKWINRALRSIGEPPQLYDSAQTLQSQMNLQMQLQNMGFLRATVDVRNDIKGRKLITNYLLHPGQPYFIRHLRFDIQDSLIARIPDIYDPSYVTLRRGMLFNAANLDNERVRITKMLTNHGYYRFNKDFITYRADSIENTPYVDLTLVLHRFRNNEVTDTLHQQYTIGKIQYRNGRIYGIRCRCHCRSELYRYGHQTNHHGV